MADDTNQQGPAQQNNPAPAAPQQKQSPPGGTRFDVTPSSPLGPNAQPPSGTSDSMSPAPKGSRGLSFKPDIDGEKLRLIGAGVLAIIIIAAIVIFVIPALTSGNNTTSSSTVPVIVASYLSQCGVVSSPGSYYLSGNIKDTNIAGACINITSDNVAIICNGDSITGSGPFVGVPPFSFGIQAIGVSNETVAGCIISNFSYGLFSSGVNDFNYMNNNITMNYQSNIYLSASNNGTVQNNVVSNSSSNSGAIKIVNGSSDNLFINNTLKTNAIYGFNIYSTGNRFTNNNVSGSGFSFYCNAEAGFANNNQGGQSNVCFNNYGCGFLSCSGVNIPDNVSKITLGSQISTCGSINAPGSYQLVSNVDLRNFVNASNSSLAQISASCITVNASDVSLNCQGFTIQNSYIGISAQNINNLQISNCNVRNSVIGILLGNISGSAMNKITLTHNNVSLQLQNSAGNRISNVSASNSKYGMSLLSSGANIFSSFNASDDFYGLYVSNSLGNIFNSGSALNNTKFDVFATPDSVNASANIMGSTSCGLTDASWAPCAQQISASLSYLPITSCAVITKPGNYSLTQSIFGGGNNCINIAADNVEFSCQGTNINANGAQDGPAIYANGRNNITIKDCGIANYKTGVAVYNSTQVTLKGILGTNLLNYGIILSNLNNSSIINNWIAGPINVSIYVKNVQFSNVSYNNASYGNAQNYAYLIQNSSHNIILGNTGIRNYVGMRLAGTSLDNLITNNSFIFSNNNDFICDPQNNPLNAERGGINYGPFSTGCWWLASIPKSGQSLQCAASLGGGSFYSLASDGIYGLGGTCFSVFDNHTIINCAGHTILATAGGTFVKFVNSQASTIENCFLKGFTTPIVAVNSSAIILNNTIFQNLTQNSFNPVVNITNSSYPVVQNNNFLTPYTGIYLSNVSYAKVKNNNVSAGQDAYQFYHITGSTISNNTAQSNSGVGAFMSNSTLNVVGLNNFKGITSGFVCEGSARGSTNNTDTGQNICSTNSNCKWISQSSLTCH